MFLAKNYELKAIVNLMIGVVLLVSNPVYAKDIDANINDLKNAAKNSDKKQQKEIISNILSQDKNNVLALNYLAVIHIRDKKFGLARLVLDRALKIEPNNPTLYNNLAVIDLYEGDEKAALGGFLTAVRKKKSYPILKSSC